MFLFDDFLWSLRTQLTGSGGQMAAAFEPRGQQEPVAMP